MTTGASAPETAAADTVAPERATTSWFGWWLAAIGASAFVVRAGYALTLGAFTGVTDPRYYHLQANLIADGHGFAEPYASLFAGELVPTAVHPPLFPLVLSVSSALGGTSVTAHRLVACLIGALAVVAIGLLAREIGGRGVGLGAAVLAALYPNLWVLDSALFSEGLSVLLVTLALLAAYRLRRSPTVLGAGLLGAAIGLAALTRPETITLVAVLAAPVFLLLRELAWSRRFLLLAVTTVVCGLLVAPWIVRNATGFERRVLFSTNADTVLGATNCERTYYRSELLGWWAAECLGEVSLLDDLSVHADVQRDRGLEYAREHSGRLLGVVAWARLARLFDVYRPLQTAELEVPEGRPLDVSRAGLVVYWLLVPFAVAGAVSLHRRRTQPLWPLLTPVAVACLVALYSYGNVRFRAIAEPVLVILAALGIDALLRVIVKNRARTICTP